MPKNLQQHKQGILFNLQRLRAGRFIKGSLKPKNTKPTSLATRWVISR
ncbi:hypothetical protein GCWU000324_02223 [Kingella oralis ATCC 51147]|uniref:Uncharacterized protein n=1 Tax=Kingella oralis ATCC 51147 TaxID=629741 RepID=C4GJK1_9NEIS|nr:hypothetical protein GCWU000324_02223 [Kingella oralis ATCC 51147]